MPTHSEAQTIANLARVPEHSLSLMQAMSGGSPLRIGDYLFFYSADWLMAIGYPLAEAYDQNAFSQALAAAQEKTGAKFCFAIASELPASLTPHIIEKDRYYVLSAKAPIPQRLRNPVKRAAALLTVNESAEFTAGHRKLWAEFLERNGRAMNARVAELYSQTPKAMRQSEHSLRLLDAMDSSGNIVASLLIDYSAQKFSSYILGAHSRKHYAPHAVDLLFAKMLELAAERGKKFIHLGLGVNDGILRFKRKWGAVPSLPYTMAQWETRINDQKEETAGRILARAILQANSTSARQFLQNEPSQRPFAMLWQLEKNGRTSWIAGTAHFFCHSFENSFRSLFKRVDTVLFEGPLDPTFMEQVDKAGKVLPKGYIPLIEQLTEAEIQALEKTVRGPTGAVARALGLEKSSRADTRWLLANSLPWYAFFTLWTAYLERQGWRQSVDMEAWRIAQDMGKNVIGMENLDEQLESLLSLPVERALNFFRNCRKWKKRASLNMKSYLAGDLEKMMGSSAEFPTHTEHIIDGRDQRFRERMRPYLEKGQAAVFVGSAHMVNLRHMLKEDGFNVRQAPFGLWPKIHLTWRRLWRPDEKVQW